MNKIRLQKIYFFIKKVKAIMLYKSIGYYDNLFSKACYINIGGGPLFLHRKWLNLDEVVADGKQSLMLKFSPDCRFPVKSNSIKIVYSSHCLEHLNDKTIYRVLDETKRVMIKKGFFLLKLPDFDAALKEWRENRTLFFKTESEGNHIKTWKNRNVSINDLNKLSIWFAGFWNKAYGNHFNNQINYSKNAYHGPAIVSCDKLENLFMNYSPSDISRRLVKIINDNEKEFVFNHQNAWSREELELLLNKKGLAVRSFDKNFIINKFSYIPGISEMFNDSMYVLCSKN